MTKLNHSFLSPVIIENGDQHELKKVQMPKHGLPPHPNSGTGLSEAKKILVSMIMESLEVTVVKGSTFTILLRFTGRFKHRGGCRGKVCRSFFQYRKDKKVIT